MFLAALPDELVRDVLELALREQIEISAPCAAGLLLVSRKVYSWLVKLLYRVLIVTKTNIGPFTRLLETRRSPARHIRHLVINHFQPSAYFAPTAHLEIDTLIASSRTMLGAISHWHVRPRRLFFVYSSLLHAVLDPAFDQIARNITHLRISQPFCFPKFDAGPRFPPDVASRLPSLEHVVFEPVYQFPPINHLNLMVWQTLSHPNVRRIVLPLTTVVVVHERAKKRRTSRLVGVVDDPRIIYDASLWSPLPDADVDMDEDSFRTPPAILEDIVMRFARVVWDGGDPWLPGKPVDRRAPKE